MTKEEYVRSLVDDNVPGDQWFDLVKQWEIDNPKTEEVEEVKTEVVADQAGAAVTTTTDEASDMASESEDGFSEFQEVELDEIKITGNNPYNAAELTEELGIDVWANFNDEYSGNQQGIVPDLKRTSSFNQKAMKYFTDTKKYDGPNGPGTYTPPKPTMITGTPAEIQDKVDEGLDSNRLIRYIENPNGSGVQIFPDTSGTQTKKIFDLHVNQTDDDDVGKNAFNSLMPINIPDLQARRTFKQINNLKQEWDFGYDTIFDYGDKYLDENEKEFKQLNIDYENAEEGSREKKKLNRQLEKLAKKRNYGSKLYDTKTGDVIDIEKASTQDLENYQESEILATTTEKDDLENGLQENYYKLLALSKDVREVNNELGVGRLDDDGSKYGLDSQYVKKDENGNIVGYTDEFYSKEGGPIQPDEFGFVAPDWNTGDTAFTYPIGNIRQGSGTLPKGLIENINTFIETGEIPKGLKEIPSSHPVAEAYNNALNSYVVYNQAMQLNRNPIFMKKSKGADDFFDSAIGIFGENTITTYERKNLFADALTTIGFDMDAEEITDETSRNFGNFVGGGLPILGEFLAKLYLTKKVLPVQGAQATAMITKGTEKTIKMSAPWIKKAVTEAAKIPGSAFDFGAVTALYGEEGESILDSALFGASMPIGHIAFSGFSKFLNTRHIMGYTPVVQRLMKNPMGVSAKLTTSLGQGQGAAFSYQFGSYLQNVDNYMEELQNEGSGLLMKHAEETVKMMVMGRVLKGVKGLDNVSYAFQDSFLRMYNRNKYNKRASDGASYMDISKKTITDPSEDSYKEIEDREKEMLNGAENLKEKGDISPEEYQIEVDKIKESSRDLKNQLAVNQMATMIKENQGKPDGKLISQEQAFVISEKIKAGDALTEKESDLLNQPGTSPLMIADRLGIQQGTANFGVLQNYMRNNSLIQHRLNGGGVFFEENGVLAGTNQDFYSSNPKRRDEAYKFLLKQQSLNQNLAKLQEFRKEDNITESEKLELDSKIKGLKEEIKDYSSDGKIGKALIDKIAAENLEVLEKEIATEYDLPGSTKGIQSKQELQDSFNEWVKRGDVQAKNVKDVIAVVNPVTGEAFINIEKAKEVKDFTAKNHEDIHRLWLNSFKDKKGNVTEEGIKIIDDVVGQLSDNQQQVLQKNLESRDYDLSKPKGEWYEEKLSILSELIKNKQITFTESFGEQLKSFIPLLKKNLPNLDVDNVTGKQMFDMIRGFAEGKKESIDQAEAFARDAKEAAGEMVTTEEMEAKASAAKAPVQTLIEEFKANPEGFRKDAELLENVKSLAAVAMGYNSKFQQEQIKKGGKGVSQDEFTSFVGNQIPILKKRYDKEKNGADFSTYVTATFRRKMGDMLRRAGITEDQYKGISIEELKDRGTEIADTNEAYSEAEYTGVQKDPFSLVDPSFKAEFDAKQKEILDNAEENGIDINSTKFKDKQALAPYQALADYFGIPVERITVSSDNFRKGDNVKKIQKWVFDNAKDLMKVALSPGNTRKTQVDSKAGNKKIKIGGDPMGIPKLIRDKFYVETGKKDGNKQYTLRNDISIPEFLETFGVVNGKINKDVTPRNNQALKGIMKMYGMSLSNKSTRDVTAEKIEEGSVTEAEGMLTIASNLDLKPEASLSSGRKTFETVFNEILESKGLPKLPTDSKERVKMYRDLALNDLVSEFGETTPELMKWLGTGGIRVPTRGSGTGGKMVGVSQDLQKVVDQYGLYKNENDVNAGFTKEVSDYIKANRDGSILELVELNKELGQEIESRDIKIDPEQKRLMSLALKTQTLSQLEDNKKNYDDIQQGKDLIFDKFRKIATESPDKLAGLIGMIYSGNANNHPFRGFATVLGAERGLGVTGREEHIFQYGNFANSFVKAISGTDKVYDGFKEWAGENYFQIKISKEQKDILDQATVNKNRFTGEIITPFSPSSGEHPVFKEAMKEALETGDFSKVPDVRLRYASEYFTANLNKIGREYRNEDGNWEYRTDAEDFNITVDKPFENNQSVINEQGRLAYQIMLSEKGYIKEGEPNYTTRETAREAMNAFEAITPTKDGLVDQINKNEGGSNNFTNNGIKVITGEQNVFETRTADIAATNGRTLEKELKSLTAVDADNTTLVSKNQVIGTRPDGSKIMLRTEEFGEQASALEAEGVTFDFSDFMKIKDGKPAAYFKRLKEQYKQHGPENLFVVSARPPEFAEPMRRWLESNKINIPVENIIGLGNGTPQAKANWFLGKAAEGYNDFLFADDILANVKAVKDVIDVVDVKGPVQAKLSAKPITFDKIFNKNLELKTSEMKGQTLGADWTISAARAQSEGKLKNKNMFSNFFTGYSAEDFNGLLYATLPKGKQGDAMYEFYNDNLINPYNRAERRIESAKIAAASDFKALKDKLTKLPKSMNTETGIGNYSFGDAARVAVWTKQGMEIPGLSKRDQKKLNKFVSENGDLNVFVNEIGNMQKGKQYPKPKEGWISGTLSSDIMGEINKVNRKEYLQEWKENTSIIFSDNNKNKLRFAFGDKYVESLENVLGRMESGSNRAPGGNRTVDNILDWVNGSVGATMFLNTRSAALQTISSVNYINWGDNNLYKAGKAFANQPQYWKDFKKLFNSDYLKNRREGLNINVSESEIASAAKKGGAKGAIAYLLNQGFVMTRGADSFAIASGGATMYRNRVESLIKGGMPKEMAEAQAMDAWRKISEENQQSSSPMRISQQQASGAGRVVLAFSNTPMQYNRIIKRSAQDLINKRGDWKSNVSKIVYYGAAQNLVFNALQNSLWTEAFDEDGDETGKGARTINGMGDSLLNGLGIQGKAALAVKNSLVTIAKENKKDSPEFRKAISDLFDFSPPLDTKIRKLNSAANTFSWQQEEIANQGFSLNNPAYLATAQVVTAATNIPADRAIQKINNIRQMFSENSEKWQKVALALGWSSWDVGLGYYGVEEKVDQTPEMILKEKVTTMKKETSIKEQKDLLLELGLTKQQIKALKYENERVKKILELQEKNLKE